MYQRFLLCLWCVSDPADTKLNNCRSNRTLCGDGDEAHCVSNQTDSFCSCKPGFQKTAHNTCEGTLHTPECPLQGQAYYTHQDVLYRVKLITLSTHMLQTVSTGISHFQSHIPKYHHKVTSPHFMYTRSLRAQSVYFKYTYTSNAN